MRAVERGLLGSRGAVRANVIFRNTDTQRVDHRLGWHIVFRVTRIIPPVICVCLVVTVFAACGGDPSSGAVAQVGGYAITKATLDQWMTEKVNQDYYLVVNHKAPPQLVSEPADYPACIASLKTVTPIPGEGKPHPPPTVTQLTSKCKELYQGVKTQALAYIVSSYWSINLDAENGIKATNEEAQQELNRIKAAQYPTEKDFQQLLANRRRTFAQELFMAKMDVLGQKVEKQLKNDSPQQSATFIRDAKKRPPARTVTPDT